MINDFFISSRDTDTHRVCGACDELLPNEEFYRDGKDNYGKTRYRRDCKSCYKTIRLHEARFKERKMMKT